MVADRYELFPEIQFEVEHPLFLARIRQRPTGEMWKSSALPKSEDEQVEHLKKVIHGDEEPIVHLPIIAVEVYWLPKFHSVPLGSSEKSAYRVLYRTSYIVGEYHDEKDLHELTLAAKTIAQTTPDPVHLEEREEGNVN